MQISFAPEVDLPDITPNIVDLNPVKKSIRTSQPVLPPKPT
jgi:hypothetical protein